MLIAGVDAYLTLRRSLGFKLHKAERNLRGFAQFCEARKEPFLRADLAVEWAGRSSSRYLRSRQLKEIAALARHLRADDPRHELPPAGLYTCLRPRRVPHIFSLPEIRRLLEAALQLGPEGTLRPLVFHTLIALLACTGLRISEALRLRFGDLTDDGLLIEQTKFKKSRLVSLHPLAREALQRYLLQRRKREAVHDHLFISLSGGPLRVDRARNGFLALLRSVGLRSQKGLQGPHLHDLRHTFAVRALESAPKDKRGVGRHMVALSTYLGHTHLSDTYWYLHATPQLMREMADDSSTLLFGGGR